jgi:hypothetical protein
MHISKFEHRPELLLLRIIKTAGSLELRRIVVGPEEHVPPNDIAIVVFVGSVFMVDSVHFGPLKDVSNPLRRPDVGVIKELAHRGAEGIDCSLLS